METTIAEAPNSHVLSEDEIAVIRDIQGKYVQKLGDIGKAEINIMNIENSLATIEQQKQELSGNRDLYIKKKDELKQEVMQVQRDEQTFMKSLSDKYGSGKLDISTMIFTKNS
jgi:hypothetical protein